MQIVNVSVDQERGTPVGIDADVVYEPCGKVFEVYRSWDNPQWYLYDVVFNEGDERAGIEDLDQKYRIPQNSELHAKLEEAVDSVRADYSPA